MKNNITQSVTTVALSKFGDPIFVPIRYSKKAKRIIIRINMKRAELILSAKNFNSGYKFLLEKELWVRQKLKNIINNDSIKIEENILPILGKKYSLLHIDSPTNSTEIEQDTIKIYSASNTYKETLVKFLKNRLLLEITKLISIFSSQYKLNFSAIKIRDNKTRWGSCSHKRVLSFNLRLVFAPPEILKYVVAHEMCHLVEMNHSPSFWSLVAKLYPDYKSARLWLKENGYKLHQHLQF